MNEITLNVPNISCGHCVNTIQNELEELPGVKMVSASSQTKQVQITFEAPANVQQIRDLLKEINYPASN